MIAPWIRAAIGRKSASRNQRKCSSRADTVVISSGNNTRLERSASKQETEVVFHAKSYPCGRRSVSAPTIVPRGSIVHRIIKKWKQASSGNFGNGLFVRKLRRLDKLNFRLARRLINMIL